MFYLTQICLVLRKLPREFALLLCYSLLSNSPYKFTGLTTVIPNHIFNIEQIITAADKALYQAKAAGRNCFKHNNLLITYYLICKLPAIYQFLRAKNPS
ncbi:diguanylate cyclase [Nostoc sp. FACHB-888]|nr:diguanylate cyclase [Nostoc sp. FACHB-888]